MHSPILTHITSFLGGAATLSLIAHGVNTFPTPNNKYGAWLLGLIQYAVGQRVAAKNTMSLMDTIARGVPKNNKDDSKNDSIIEEID